MIEKGKENMPGAKTGKKAKAMASPIILGERPSALAACNTAKRLVFPRRARPGSIAALQRICSPPTKFLRRATGIDGVCPYALSRSSTGRSTPGEYPATNNRRSLPQIKRRWFFSWFCCTAVLCHVNEFSATRKSEHEQRLISYSHMRFLFEKPRSAIGTRV